jgi:hypothetical protein
VASSFAKAQTQWSRYKSSRFSKSLQKQQIQQGAAKAAVPAGYCKRSGSSEYNGVKFENLPIFSY